MLLQQIMCTIKVRRVPTRNDNRDFKSVLTRIAEIPPLSIVTADKGGYDSEDNHFLVREELIKCIPYNPCSIRTCTGMENTW